MVFCKHYFVYLIEVKHLTLKSFHFCLLVVFDRSHLFEPNEHFFQKFESSLEVQRAKRKFLDNLGHNILELYDILVQILLTTSKTEIYIQYSKLGIRVASRVPQRPKTQDLTKLRNIKKILNLGGHIVQCLVSIQELSFCQQQLKNTQNIQQSFIFLSSFTGLLHFLPNILSEIL